MQCGCQHQVGVCRADRATTRPIHRIGVRQGSRDALARRVVCDTAPGVRPVLVPCPFQTRVASPIRSVGGSRRAHPTWRTRASSLEVVHRFARLDWRGCLAVEPRADHDWESRLCFPGGDAVHRESRPQVAQHGVRQRGDHCGGSLLGGCPIRGFAWGDRRPRGCCGCRCRAVQRRSNGGRGEGSATKRVMNGMGDRHG